MTGFFGWGATRRYSLTATSSTSFKKTNSVDPPLTFLNGVRRFRIPFSSSVPSSSLGPHLSSKLRFAVNVTAVPRALYAHSLRPATKQSFADTRVTKLELGSREGKINPVGSSQYPIPYGATFVAGLLA